MAVLSEESREVIVKKAFGATVQTRLEIARSHNIGFSTLGKWIARYKEKGLSVCLANKPLSALERFEHLQITYAFDDVKMGAYCRKHGFYSHQLQEWKEEFMSKSTEQNIQHQATELKTLRLENKQLKREVLRKDKALAETAALLVLKKKAAHIWGDGGDA